MDEATHHEVALHVVAVVELQDDAVVVVHVVVKVADDYYKPADVVVE